VVSCWQWPRELPLDVLMHTSCTQACLAPVTVSALQATFESHACVVGLAKFSHFVLVAPSHTHRQSVSMLHTPP
jgi:hypothetical protein